MTASGIPVGVLLSMMIFNSPQKVPFDSGRWQWNAAESRVVEHLGRKSLYLRGGSAIVNDAYFTDGIIEFDVAFSRDRGFMGGIWRVQDPKNYEEFYVRPHQSGNPDATQYTPVFNGLASWQLYHGDRYTVPLKYRFDEWIHVKIVFGGGQAEIYVDDMERPALFVEELKRPLAPGRVGVSVADFGPAHFSNFTFSIIEEPRFKSRPRVPEKVPDGVISSWQVSDAFRENALEDVLQLSEGELGARRWTRLETERGGLTNFARLRGIHLGKNTVFAKKVIVSDREQIKKLEFGFSDRVSVYLNNRLLFRGDDTYQSRDYRFLGSIGYFDALYLPLVAGENELLMAVSEDFGGWGIQAKFESLEGITLQD